MVDQLNPSARSRAAGPPRPRDDTPSPLTTQPPLTVDEIVVSGIAEEFEDVQPRQPGLKNRAAWTFIDQGVSSATNFLLAALVARSAGIEGFGSFSIAFAAYSFVIGIGRAVISDPLMIRFSAASPREQRMAMRQAAGAAVALGVVSALIVAATAAVVGPGFGLGLIAEGLIALAITLPGLLVQDAWRFSLFVQGRAAAAAVNDTLWAVVMFGLMAGLIAAGETSVLLLTLAWGIGACVAALFGCFQLRALPQVSASVTWFRTHAKLSFQMGADYIINMAAVNITTFVIAGIGGLAATAALRAAQVLLGPLQLAFAGLSAFVLPVFARRAGEGRSLAKPVFLVGAVLGLIAAAWTLVLLVTPDSVGELIFNDNWAGASQIMLASGVMIVGVALAVGPALGVKAFGRAELGLKITGLQAPLTLGLGTLGVLWAGAQGAAIGMAVAQFSGMIMYWLFFSTAQSDVTRGEVPVFARHARSYDRWSWAVGSATPRHGPTTRGVVVPTRPAQAAGRHVLRRLPR